MPEQPNVQRLLGLALRELRTAEGITQEELSMRTGVHATYVSDVERGARNPSWGALVKLLDGLAAGMGDLGAAYDRLANQSGAPQR